MITINLNNKVAYTLIAVLIILSVSLVVYAYGGSSPNIMGHSIGEIAAPTGCSSGQVLSWTGSSWSCVAQSTSSGGCSELLNTDGLGNNYETSIDVPSGCRGDKGCHVSVVRVDESDDNVLEIGSKMYFQASDPVSGKMWVASGNTGVSEGANGDSSGTDIIGSLDSAWLKDDDSGVEGSAQQWSFRDGNGNNYFRVIVCEF